MPRKEILRNRATWASALGFGCMRLILASSFASIALACSAQTPLSGDTDPMPGTSSTSSSTGGSTTDDAETSSGEDTSFGDESSSGEGPPAIEEPYTTGDRLRPVVHRSETGDLRLQKWFDPELDMDCYFQETEPGTFICSPAHIWSVSRFADPQCSEPATTANPCAPLPQYGRRYAGGCAPSEVWQRGEPLETTYRIDAEGACVGTPEPDAYRLEPADLSTFVAATRSLQAVDGDLGRWEFEADDGSTQWVGPIVLDREDFCAPTEVGEMLVCIDSRVAWISGTRHQDAACSGDDVASAGSDETCPDPRFVRSQSGEVKTITGTLEADAVWQGAEGGSCTPLLDLSNPPNDDLYTFRDLESADAPALLRDRDGESRLRLQTLRTLEGAALTGPYYAWFDSELDVECQPASDDFGEQRCGPGTNWSTDLFTDATCSTAILRDGGYVYEDAWLTLTEYTIDEGCSQRRLIGAGQVGDVYSGDVYRLSAEDCERIDDPAYLGTLRVFSTFYGTADLAVLEEVRL